MTIGEIIKNKQPNNYYKLIIVSKSNIDNTIIKDLWKMLLFSMSSGALRQVRNG